MESFFSVQTNGWRFQKVSVITGWSRLQLVKRGVGWGGGGGGGEFCKRRKITREARIFYHYPDQWTQSLATPAGQHQHRTEHITVSQIMVGVRGGVLRKEKISAREKKKSK